MRTALVIVAVILAVSALALGGLYLWCTTTAEEEWTTSSPEARKELKEGVDDLSKRYFLDAIRHFERALELDPHMPAGKFFLAQIYSELPDLRDTYLKPLRETDPAAMNDRERLLRTYLLSTVDGERAAGHEAVTDYLKTRPDDLWALDLKCSEAWLRRDWAEADTCYRHMLEVDPNWVEAQGRLGYIAMARGRFDEAEELFRTYAYIAPDQAAPHADIGQLATVLGRYDEAEQELDKALAIKDDFCEAHHYKVSLQTLQRRFPEAMETLDSMEQIPACSIYEQWGVYCATRSWLYYLEGDIEAAKNEMNEQCLAARGGWDATYHRVSALTGDTQLATDLLDKARQGLQGEDDDPEARTFFVAAIVQHMEGIGEAVAGNWPAACDHFQAADEGVQYWMIYHAAFKLRNRQDLLVCLKKTGRNDEAAKLASEISAVNPLYLKAPMVTDLQKLAGVQVP